MGVFVGKRALITGSSSGIGAAVAVAYAAEGATVAINYPTAVEAEAAENVLLQIEAVGGTGIAIQGDVADEDDASNLVEQALQDLGGIDVLVNNAGIASAAPVESLAVSDWDRMIAVHLRSVFLVTRKVLPLMYEQQYGKIINTASQLAYKGAAGFSHYTAAKGAIISFTRSLALEIGERNINANCVAPGATSTPILADVPDTIIEAIRQSIPKGRLADVEDVVPAYVFLASDSAKHFQGQCLSPNGGDVFL